MTYLHLTVNSIATANSTLRATAAVATVVAPISATLAIRTITCHMASIAANTADNVGGKVALFGTVVLAMTDLSTYTR
jgi:hypothetical protein